MVRFGSAEPKKSEFGRTLELRLLRISLNDLGHPWNKFERNAEADIKTFYQELVGLTNQLKIVLS